MVTASHLLLLLSDGRIDQPDGEIIKESSTFRWSDSDMRNTLGTIDLVMDLEATHRQPEKYPVARLELELSNLEDEIVPEHVNGYIVVNGYDVEVAAVVRALQIGN